MAAPCQEVITLPLQPSLRQLLVSAGYRTTADLAGARPVDLASELHISPEDALLALKIANVHKDSGLLGVRSAQQLYEKEIAARKIITFCGDLDNVLGGGIATGQITEFCGVPAVGKTQLGIQLAVDVQIPPTFGGLGAAAVYIAQENVVMLRPYSPHEVDHSWIGRVWPYLVLQMLNLCGENACHADTEGSFMVDRVEEIADACVRHLKKLANNNGTPAQEEAASNISTQLILSNIHFFRVRDYTEQLAVARMMPSFVDSHPQVKIIIIDSIAFHFRQDFQDMAQRTRVLAEMAQNLMQLAEDRDLAVVLMNQVTTKVLGNNQGSKLVPALGDSWAHVATSRVVLFWQEQTRSAFLYKSPYLPAKTAEYFVTADGIRGRRSQKRTRTAQ